MLFFRRLNHISLPRDMDLLWQLMFACIGVPLSLAFPEYIDRIPNGKDIPGAGHVNANGGGKLNQFGKDFETVNYVWNTALCEADSDGDNLSNGEELGDPLCTWSMDQGEPPLHELKSHPGVPANLDPLVHRQGAHKAARKTLIDGVKRARHEL